MEEATQRAERRLGTKRKSKKKKTCDFDTKFDEESGSKADNESSNLHGSDEESEEEEVSKKKRKK